MLFETVHDNLQALAHHRISSTRDAFLFIITIALAVHALYNKYEIQPENVFATLSLLIGLPTLASLALTPHVGSYGLGLILTLVVFYTCLLSSIVIYRLSPFHPLAKFPGPRYLRVSKLFGMWIASGGKQQIFFKRLHEKYGPFVRTGPNEISTVDAQAIPSVLGSQGLPKGPMWDAYHTPDGMESLIAMRNPAEHLKRRRLWNRAFSSASVKEYEPTVRSRVRQLAECLHRLGPKTSADTPVDLSHTFGCFTFDVMGDMMFGGGFELMKEGDVDKVWEVVEKGMENFALLQHIPWVMQILWKIPFISGDVNRLKVFCKTRARVRLAEGSQVKDVYHYLIDDDNHEAVKPTFEQVVGDAALAVIAGADTTATALTTAFYYLLRDPAKYKQLQEEVDTYFPADEGEPFDAATLAKMPYLNVTINEAIRLQPPVPSCTQRGTPQGNEGKLIGSYFVPGGTAVWLPLYPLLRDPRYFSPHPDDFLPERWLSDTKDDFVTNTDAFIPFSFGPANCAGKNLAWVEMRMAVALLMQRFQMRFAEGFDPLSWEDGLEDCLVLKRGKLPVILALRG
ncbi:high nitrogen upregulated cytochrome P450 monooxygenase 2 [Schizopora paradoxa]|uniref:High nitrogen upregulated cytochrome P450 monooxygenase 2 n=1 Tax=Schizopora paradoxa TaxID=27342 RepID=A0A0H2RQC3_9AGAM|nr:high nitrogen upregulated cytochrome P450 monooxygenase 2 [Schizopora paradoxa]